MIRFLILGFTILCINVAYGAKDVARENAKTSAEAQKYQKNKTEKITETTFPGSKEPIFNTSNPLSTNDTESQGENPQKQRKEGLWEKLLNDPVALLTGLLAFVTGLLWLATRKLVVGAERTAEQQLRAYVYTKHDQPATKSAEGNFMASVWVKNFGQTPAKDLIII